MNSRLENQVNKMKHFLAGKTGYTYTFQVGILLCVLTSMLRQKAIQNLERWNNSTQINSCRGLHKIYYFCWLFLLMGVDLFIFCFCLLISGMLQMKMKYEKRKNIQKINIMVIRLYHKNVYICIFLFLLQDKY